MSQTVLPRESVEYLEILSDVFVELVRKMTNARASDAASEVTPSLAQCLEYIYLHGPSPMRRIAAGLSVTIPAASQLVDRLVHRGLVTREHSEKDRRLARVDLTEEGKMVVRSARAARTAWLRRILDRMASDRRAALVDSLEEFIRLALEADGRVGEACVRCGIDHLAFCVVSKAHVTATGEPFEEY